MPEPERELGVEPVAEEVGELAEPITEMPAVTTGARINRGTVQIGLPGSVILVLSAFDLINWNELQTTAVLGLSYQAIMMIMNLTPWGRKIFAPS